MEMEMEKTAPMKIWKFWHPDSGALGGMLTALLLLAVLKLLQLLFP